MKILSWDVGIRNLAYCLMEKNNSGEIKILKWDVIDLIGEVPEIAQKCEGHIKKGNPCTRVAKWKTELGKFCNQHISDDIEKMPLIPEKKCCQTIGKKNVKGCQCKVFYQNKEDKTYYCKRHGKKINGLNIIKGELTNFELCKMITQKIEAIPELMDVDEVAIENQPTLKNPRMKTIQVMLFSQFVMRDINNRIKNVSYISATNKLKEAYQKVDLTDIPMPSNDKAKRKKLGIIYTKELLKQDAKSLEILNNHSKKDDLCDSYLQGLYYLQKNGII
jgi:hypothetical protein